MTNGAVRDTHPSDAAMATELGRLGLRFVTSSVEDALPYALSPGDLIAALAGSKEARLRMGLIPLFIVHPEYARFVSSVADGLVGQGWITLVCYYTAAVLLQRKYLKRLASLGLDLIELPNVFADYLKLPLFGDPDNLLLHLAQEQARLSGRSLNWYGTYEHAMERFVRRRELEATWAKS